MLLAVDFDRVTVQVVLALDARLAAAHCREERVTAGAAQGERGWLGRAVQRGSDGGGLIGGEGCRGSDETCR